VKYFSRGHVDFSGLFNCRSEARVGDIGGVRGVWRGRYLFTIIGVGTGDLSDAEVCLETAAIAAAEARLSAPELCLAFDLDFFGYGD
jgi:hypothetical protein